MCGIFGVVASNNGGIKPKQLLAITQKLFLLSESRGKEASGFAAIVDNEIKIFKMPFAADRMIKSKEYHSVFNRVFDGTDPYQVFIGHSRLVTDGYEHENRNNQPVTKNGMAVIHNGIIVNKDKLWEKYRNIERESDLDSELIPVILNNELAQTHPEEKAFQKLFSEIYGMTNIALLSTKHDNLFLATNNGSIYYLPDALQSLFLFASERFILEELIHCLRLEDHFSSGWIKQLEPISLLSVSFTDQSISLSDLKDGNGQIKNIQVRKQDRGIQELEYRTNQIFINTSLEHKEFIVPPEFMDEYEKRRERIGALKRCMKCLLPETFPLIRFDDDGVCNVCTEYLSNKTKGEKVFLQDLQPYLDSQKGDYDCLVAFSGGRDSSYMLYYLKERLGLKPLAYSYDWGMLTDLARRNQARICGKLGIEHILVSADIRKKRKNIQLNVSAWLKKPSLGAVPLFMAGDKQYFYFANLIKKQNDINAVVMGENLLEKTGFKIGFSGASQEKSGSMAYHMSTSNKLRMLYYYGQQYATNLAYINESLPDTISAYLSYYSIPHHYINFYDYIPWKEDEVEDVLLNFFDWETDPGTETTWRIGDGTAAFYNYIYYMLAGFTENDTFRSNQIREGDLSRDKAMERSIIENQPRWDSLKWYCDTIQIDFEKAISIINRTKALYDKIR